MSALVLAALALGALLLAGGVALHAYWSEASVFTDQRREVPLSAEAATIAGLRAVSLREAGLPALRGWYAPARNRAAVVFTHGSGGDRRDGWSEASVLAARGFGVLLFDFPGHGESEGEIRWDVPEEQALVDALNYLSRLPEIDPARLGVVGFSMGGVIATRVAAQDPRVRALALLATPSQVRAHLEVEYQRWGFLGSMPAALALERHGMEIDARQPLELVPTLAPRALLLVGGSEDRLVPPWMARALFDAAHEPKQLQILEGAGHGGFAAARPEVLSSLLGSFFERGLRVATQ